MHLRSGQSQSHCPWEADGYPTAHGEVVQGRERKVYILTDRGREAFRTAVGCWLEATGYILAGEAAAEVARYRREMATG